MTSQELVAHFRQTFPDDVLGTHMFRGDATVTVRASAIVDVCRHAQSDPRLRFNLLMDLSAVDYLTFGKTPQSAPLLASPSPRPFFMRPKPVADEPAWERHATDAYRFEVVYHLYSVEHGHRLRLKAPVKASEAEAPSVTGVWASANWYEREVWDMFGIRFANHPDLRRLLMYEEFEGHPLRKDYPVNQRQPLIGPKN